MLVQFQYVLYSYFLIACNLSQTRNQFSKSLKLYVGRRILFASQVINSVFHHTRFFSQLITTYLVLFKKFIKHKFSFQLEFLSSIYSFHTLMLEHYLPLCQGKLAYLDIAPLNCVYLKQLKAGFSQKSQPALERFW